MLGDGLFLSVGSQITCHCALALLFYFYVSPEKELGILASFRDILEVSIIFRGQY